MAEGLVARIGRLISGGVNAAIDGIENQAPELVMEEAIREIKDVITEVRAELGKIVASQHLAVTRFAGEQEKGEKLAREIALALQENQEDLARAGVEKQLDIEDQIPILQKTIDEGEEKKKELEVYITGLQAKKRGMISDLNDLLALEKGENSLRSESKVDAATSSFDRVMSNAGSLSASTDTDDEMEAKLRDLETLSRNKRIQERLLSLKAQPSSKEE